MTWCHLILKLSRLSECALFSCVTPPDLSLVIVTVNQSLLFLRPINGKNLHEICICDESLAVVCELAIALVLNEDAHKLYS